MTNSIAFNRGFAVLAAPAAMAWGIGERGQRDGKALVGGAGDIGDEGGG